MEEQLDYLAIHGVFAATEYGHALASNVRYEIYKPRVISNEVWVELLGPDVDNLAHHLVTYELTEDFIDSTESLQPGELSPRDKAILKIAAITHGWAESIPSIGDVNYSDKTASHEIAEQTAFMEHLLHFYPDASPYVTQLIEEAANQVIFNRESRLGRIFNAVERIGYLKTAAQASRHLSEEAGPEIINPGLGWLVADTLSNHHTSHLIAVGQRLPAAHRFLDIYRAELERTFDVGRAAALTCFVAFDPNRAAIKEAHFRAAEQLWDSYCGDFDAD